MYRPPNGDMTVSEKFCENVLSANNKTSTNIFFFFAVYLNINALDYESNKDIQHFLSSMFQYNMILLEINQLVVRETQPKLKLALLQTL